MSSEVIGVKVAPGGRVHEWVPWESNPALGWTPCGLVVAVRNVVAEGVSCRRCQEYSLSAKLGVTDG